MLGVILAKKGPQDAGEVRLKEEILYTIHCTLIRFTTFTCTCTQWRIQGGLRRASASPIVIVTTTKSLFTYYVHVIIIKRGV